jgi:hypothetical protein
MGTGGIIRSPDAFIFEDGHVMAGVSYYPKQELAYSNYQYDAFAPFVSCTFLPFMEVSLRITRMFGRENYTFDRMPSVRLQPLKEKKYLPAIVIGANDFITTGNARNFGAFYAVAGKNLKLKKLQTNIEINGGYAYALQKSNKPDLDGVFYGVKIHHLKLPQVKAMVEYDSRIWNYGISVLLFKRLYIQNSLLNGKHWAGNIVYEVQL